MFIKITNCEIQIQIACAVHFSDAVKANSHIPCCSSAMPSALIHARQAMPLPFSNSAVSFVKVRMVAENIRTASPTV
jgi:hypothetical protein